MENYCQYQQREPHSVWAHLLGILWPSSFFGIKFRVLRLKAKGQQREALKRLLGELAHQGFWWDHEAKWWSLMREALILAQELQLVHQPDPEPLLQLLKLCKNAPQPWQGYDVAYSFVSLSLWSFIQGKAHKALEQVKIAVHADPSWAYPEYLLGWYGLWLEGIDPVKHFVRAVHLDWHYWERLKQDPECQQFPEVLSLVKQEILAHR